jgi:DNA-binding NarL/FixJ family response regulator
MPWLRVLIVEDYEAFRRFICLALQQREAFEVIEEVSDGLEAVQKAQELEPDLILLDIGLPKLNGLEAGRRIRKVSPNSKILFLSQESSPDVVREALSLGAQGYILKARAQSDLLPAIDAVLGGKRFVSSGLEFSERADAKLPTATRFSFFRRGGSSRGSR